MTVDGTATASTPAARADDDELDRHAAGTSGCGDAVTVNKGSAATRRQHDHVDGRGDGVAASLAPLTIATTTVAVNGTGAGVFDIAGRRRSSATPSR